MSEVAKVSFSCSELAELTGCTLEGDPSLEISGVADLAQAGPSDAAFLGNANIGSAGDRYLRDFQDCQAGVIFINPEIPRLPEKTYLVNSDPSLAFQKLLDILAERVIVSSAFQGIHPSAVVHESVVLGSGVSIGPCAVIDQKVTIGDGTSIGAGCSIGPGTVIGANCTLHPNVTIREMCTLGDRVILQPGVVLGSCGFGYHTDARGQHEKLQQVGNVLIENDVEIGANTTIDRARFRSSRVEEGSKIDNLVMLAHGVEVGRHNIIVSQSGIAGSSSTGRHVVIAAQAGITGHVHLSDGVMLGGRTGVSKSLPAGKYQGTPAMPIKEWQRSVIFSRRAEKKMKALEAKVQQLEEALTAELRE